MCEVFEYSGRHRLHEIGTSVKLGAKRPNVSSNPETINQRYLMGSNFSIFLAFQLS